MGSITLRNLLVAAGLLLAAPVVSAGMATPSMLANTCAGCHGDGGNSRGPATPGIAGLSKNYIINAMLAYKHGDDEAAIEESIDSISAVVDADDLDVLPRASTIMNQIASGYTAEEIVAMADYFSVQSYVAHAQQPDAALVKAGERLHEKNCEKCHEDGGSYSEDDVGILAGQWTAYLQNSLADFRGGDRAMPKKMKAKLKDLSDDDVNALIAYYASQGK